ncbi:Crp/Fnr family transcriptional regulator [Aliifodinibius salicampi]|uniref:Crp/Fnr family transcriptional regulator n=1 Tax=Fodinibius salicampi TaxID=1920655 RepID=A0ABT3PX41_9BACT|nr:Crp/Fnr family transcriptional regulator [Fodinibius salicampi]MCW9712435.1 Crp/Fnr family transcriptional regulator [Fodinibius salicampi]
MKNLINALSFGGILSDEEVEYVTSFFEVQSIKSGDDFLSIGMTSDRIGFVDEGILREYIIGGDAKEIIKHFICKNQFAVALESFYDNKPSALGIEAVTKCRILSIQRRKWNKLYEEVPNLYILTKSLTESALLNKIKNKEFLHFGSAKDKYLEFINRYPDLALKVPQQHIASYLHITPQSLSRIRRELS